MAVAAVRRPRRTRVPQCGGPALIMAPGLPISYCSATAALAQHAAPLHNSMPRASRQVLGLWVILALAMMVGAAVLGLKWFRIRAAKKLKAKEALALARTLSRSFSFNKASPRRSASWDRAASVARTSSNFGRLGSFGRVVAAATAAAAAPSGSDTPAGSGERSEQGDGGDKGRSPFANAQ